MLSVQNLNLIYNCWKWFNELSKSQKKMIINDYRLIVNTIMIFFLVFLIVWLILNGIEILLGKKQKSDFLDIGESMYLLAPISRKMDILKRYINHYNCLNKIYNLELISRIFGIAALLFMLLIGIIVIIPIIGLIFVLFKESIILEISILCIFIIGFTCGFIYFKGFFNKLDYKKAINNIEEKIQSNQIFIIKLKTELKKIKQTYRKNNI
ncbi:hypothetical protein [Ligilactobacillus aviarius]|uniref:hypothetical protein n=1 Tax=Ligilactobacillus aviarius TaxID=1606 RepID=UPI0024B92611|nr:hypothetical protein [Ligilactobacillus aviarius]